MTKRVLALLALALPVCAQTVWREGYVNTDFLGASAFPWTYYNMVGIEGLDCNPSTGRLYNHWNYNTANWATYRTQATSNGAKLIILMGPQDWSSCTNSSNIGQFVSDMAAVINGTSSLVPQHVVFDGVDLDWEQGNINASQYESFISQLRTAVGSSKMITLVGWRATVFSTVYLNQASHLDRFNNEMYDAVLGASNPSGQAWSWYGLANKNGVAGDDGWSGSAQGGFTFYTQAGIPASKINTGIPLYGYRYTSCTHSEVLGCSEDGTQYSYKTIRNNSSWWNSQHSYDATNQSDYITLSSGSNYITYTDTDQIAALVSWGKGVGLGGYFTWELTDENLGGSLQQSFPLSYALYTDVTGGTPVGVCTITTASPLPGGTVGTAYSQTISQTSCASSSFTVSSGTLPGGLSLNASSGVISGTPTASGTFSFTVTYGSAAKAFSLTITAACSITTASPLPSGTAGSPYSVTLAQSGCTGTWGATGLPGGLSINATSGVISGTPTVPGSYSVVASIAGKTKTLSLTIAAVGSPSSYAGITFAGVTIQ